MRKNDEQQRNKKTRIVSLMLVLTLITTCLLSSTLAKYTTQLSGKDNARVAAWGFESGTLTSSTATLSLFKDQYTTDGTNVTVEAFDADGSNDDSVVAPGTSGTIDLDIKGSSEVSTKIDYAITATAGSTNITAGTVVTTGGTYKVPMIYAVTYDNGTGTVTEYYSDYYATNGDKIDGSNNYSLLYNSGGDTYNFILNGPSNGTPTSTADSPQSVKISGNVADMAGALSTASAAIDPNTPYSDHNAVITWYWPYERYTAANTLSPVQDTIDTALGTAAYAGATKGNDGVITAIGSSIDVELSITVTATQID